MFSGVPNGPLRLSPPQVHAAVHNSGVIGQKTVAMEEAVEHIEGFLKTTSDKTNFRNHLRTIYVFNNGLKEQRLVARVVFDRGVLHEPRSSFLLPGLSTLFLLVHIVLVTYFLTASPLSSPEDERFARLAKVFQIGSLIFFVIAALHFGFEINPV